MTERGIDLLRLVAGALRRNRALGIWYELEQSLAVKAMATAFTPDPDTRCWVDNTGKRRVPFNRMTEDDCKATLMESMVRMAAVDAVMESAMGRVPE